MESALRWLISTFATAVLRAALRHWSLGGKIRALMEGRFNVSQEDIRALLLPALRHRIILNFEAQADGRAADDLIEEIAAKVNPN